MAVLGAKAVSASGHASNAPTGQIRGLRGVRSPVYLSRTSYAFGTNNGLQVSYWENDDMMPFFGGPPPVDFHQQHMGSPSHNSHQYLAMDFPPPPNSPPPLPPFVAPPSGLGPDNGQFVPPPPVFDHGHGMPMNGMQMNHHADQFGQPDPFFGGPPPMPPMMPPAGMPMHSGQPDPFFADSQPVCETCPPAMPFAAPVAMPAPPVQPMFPPMPPPPVSNSGFAQAFGDSGTLTADDVMIVQPGQEQARVPAPAAPVAAAARAPAPQRAAAPRVVEQEVEYHKVPVVDFTMDVPGIGGGSAVGVGPVTMRKVAKPVRRPPAADNALSAPMPAGQGVRIEQGDFLPPAVERPSLASARVKFGEMRLNFRPDSADLSMSNIRWLQEFAEFAATQGRGQPIEIRISMENPRLQARRLALVKNAMRSSGVPESRLIPMETGRAEDSFVITLLPRPDNDFGGSGPAPTENIW